MCAATAEHKVENGGDILTGVALRFRVMAFFHKPSVHAEFISAFHMISCKFSIVAQWFLNKFGITDSLYSQTRHRQRSK